MSGLVEIGLQSTLGYITGSNRYVIWGLDPLIVYFDPWFYLLLVAWSYLDGSFHYLRTSTSEWLHFLLIHFWCEHCHRYVTRSWVLFLYGFLRLGNLCQPCWHSMTHMALSTISWMYCVNFCSKVFLLFFIVLTQNQAYRFVGISPENAQTKFKFLILTLSRYGWLFLWRLSRDRFRALNVRFCSSLLKNFSVKFLVPMPPARCLQIIEDDVHFHHHLLLQPLLFCQSRIGVEISAF